ncbi:MAG: recombinase family protein [Firmicutes bacterium]|nr:recombinase family protein [Bacillota bacterium]
MTKYAYIRVSSKEQNIDRQLEALKPFNILNNNVYCDYQSGKHFDRPAYQKLLKQLKAGDLVILKSVDRLGRNYNEILIQWQTITKDIGADILVLDTELLDTRAKNENLTGRLIADMVLQIMAYFAQTEREFIHQRQAEGIAAAKAKGKHLGRKASPLPDGFEKTCAQCIEGIISTREAAKALAMSHTTFYRHFQEWKKICAE